MQSLRKLSSPKANLIRSKTDLQIPSSDVVTGDIIHLQTNQIVRADLRLFKTFDLQIDESFLTGESLPALKTAEIMPFEDVENVTLSRFVNIAYSGTVVTKGEGYGIVYATGMKTEIGKLANELSGTSQEPQQCFRTRLKRLLKRILGYSNTSPLQRRLSLITKFNVD